MGYASLAADQDLGNNMNQARNGKILGIYVALQSAAAFADTEIMDIPDAKLEQFYKDAPIWSCIVMPSIWYATGKHIPFLPQKNSFWLQPVKWQKALPISDPFSEMLI